MIQPSYIIIFNKAKKLFGISFEECCICSSISQFMGVIDSNGESGWFNEKRDDFATLLDISKRTLQRRISKLVDDGLLERDNRGRVRVTNRWTMELSLIESSQLESAMTLCHPSHDTLSSPHDNLSSLDSENADNINIVSSEKIPKNANSTNFLDLSKKSQRENKEEDKDREYEGKEREEKKEGKRITKRVQPSLFPEYNIVKKPIVEKSVYVDNITQEKADEIADYLVNMYHERICDVSRKPAAVRCFLKALKTFKATDLAEIIDKKANDEWFMKHLSSKGVAWFLDSKNRLERYLNEER